MAAARKLAPTDADRAHNRERFEAFCEAFEDQWSLWTYANGEQMTKAATWRASMRSFFNAGLSVEELRDAVDIAAESGSRPRQAHVRDPWRYFCGVCWRMLESDAT